MTAESLADEDIGAAPPVRVLGIRHHGPGSARALLRALNAYRPDCVLIEGPCDADALIGFVPAGPARVRVVPPEPAPEGSDEPAGEPVEEVLDLDPPVALLAHAVDEPARAAFWPLASFSPEWQALVWARQQEVPARFMDLATSLVLASPEPEPPAETDTDPDMSEPDEAGAAGQAVEDLAADPQEPAARLRTDPIASLAEAAGYDDPEAWWEDVVEMRLHGEDPFDALTDAIRELREDAGIDEEILVREAHMRKVLRAASKEGFQRIAVVCGAYHAPALTGKLPQVSQDNARLRGLPKVKTQITWVPWTQQRLSLSSGYGAGVVSPGWYHHLFDTQDQPVARWLTQVAGVLRANDLAVSSAHIIEATRLAETLATMRGRPMPGLPELTEAVWSVMCEGSDLVLDLVTAEAVVGQRLGRVPDTVPAVPLDADLRATAKRLRLPMKATQRSLVLDLRKASDLARSQFFHRLQILRIEWAVPAAATTTGTFKEAWQVEWRPELAVAVVDAATYGTTVEQAAGAALLAGAKTLSDLTAAVDQALLAELALVLPELMSALDERAAHEVDLVELLWAVVPLARTQRYGDVRRTDSAQLEHVAVSILARACAGLPAASAGLAGGPAGELRKAIDEAHSVIALLPAHTQQLWTQTLTEIIGRRDVPGVIAGRLVRLLYDAGIISLDDTLGQVSRTLSRGTEPALAAAWIEAFLAGSPLLLVHQPRLLELLDAWVADISDDVFTDVLPMIRRAFGAWGAADRRRLARQVAALGSLDTADAQAPEDFLGDADLLDVVGRILGGAA
ncbi:MAG: DUF5682 family protein [Arachnia sp.]